jgi:hypothetical protein
VHGNAAKCHVSVFIFSVFSSIKSENRRAEQGLRGEEGVGMGVGEVAERG